MFPSPRDLVHGALITNLLSVRDAYTCIVDLPFARRQSPDACCASQPHVGASRGETKSLIPAKHHYKYCSQIWLTITHVDQEDLRRSFFASGHHGKAHHIRLLWVPALQRAVDATFTFDESSAKRSVGRHRETRAVVRIFYCMQRT